MAAKFYFARRTLITVSSREIIVVCGYMSYGARISNVPCLEFSDFHGRHVKDGSRQYKCHNISKTSSL